jgi:hypothetical protein
MGNFSSAGYNLVGAADGSSGWSGLDQVGTTNSPIDPLLGPLQDNGGPTLTMALRWGSPAIDAGKSVGLTTDQRGAVRPFDFPSITNAPGGDGSDIGAFEVGLPSLNIQDFGSAVVLAWPNYYDKFSVQTNGSVTASAGWATLPGTPAVIGTEYVQTNSPVSGARFFQLKSN